MGTTTLANRLKSEAVKKYAVMTEGNNVTPMLCPTDNKLSFRSAKAAERYRDHDAKNGRIDVPMEAYSCPHCRWFHLTSTLRTRRNPEHVHAFRTFVHAVRELRCCLWNPRIGFTRAHEATTAVIEADRAMRNLVFCSSEADQLRAGLRASLANIAPVHVAHAERLIVDLVPLAMMTETWQWVVETRARFVEAIEAATLEGRPEGLEDALLRHMTLLDSHIAANDLNAADVYGSEFVMVSDMTHDAVEYSVFDAASAAAVSAIVTLETPPDASL